MEKVKGLIENTYEKLGKGLFLILIGGMTSFTILAISDGIKSLLNVI